jgi:hypothetical protein
MSEGNWVTSIISLDLGKEAWSNSHLGSDSILIKLVGQVEEDGGSWIITHTGHIWIDSSDPRSWDEVVMPPFKTKVFGASDSDIGDLFSGLDSMSFLCLKLHFESSLVDHLKSSVVSFIFDFFSGDLGQDHWCGFPIMIECSSGESVFGIGETSFDPLFSWEFPDTSFYNHVRDRLFTMMKCIVRSIGTDVSPFLELELEVSSMDLFHASDGSGSVIG